MTLCGAPSLAVLRRTPLLYSSAFRHQVAELRTADMVFSARHRPMRSAVRPAKSRPQENGDNKDILYQDRILPGVSRTFALTIPQLPNDLRRVVCNTYLLCRIADTVEDEPQLSATQKQEFLSRFGRVVTGHEVAETFAQDLHPLLSSATVQAEQDLIANAARIIRVTHEFDRAQLNTIEHCLTVMTHGMAEFSESGESRWFR